MSTQELHDRLSAEDPDFILLDCREAFELELACLPGALHMPMHEIPNRIAQLDPHTTYAVICHHGVRSAQVVEFLSRAGFDEAFNVTGGIDAYARTIDRTVPLY